MPDVEHLKLNRYVKVPIARLEKTKVKTGKPRKFTPTKFKNLVNKYFDWCEENDRIPSMSGLAIHMKITRETLYGYQRYPEFEELCQQARLRIQTWCEEDIYRSHGTLVPGKALYMKNVHNWAEKQQTDITQETTIKKVLSVEDAKIKLTHLAPLLLEQLKGTLLAQISPKQIEAEIIEGEK